MELASLFLQNAMNSILSAYALANMHRVSGRKETAQAALDWFDNIELQIKLARQDLEKSVKGDTQ